MLAVTRLQIRHKSIIAYHQPLISGIKHPSLRRLVNMQHQRANRYSGTVTPGMRKRMRRAIDLMLQTSPPKWVYNPITQRNMLHRISFITLTVACPRIIEAKEAYTKLLEPFLQWMRRTVGVTTYIWKAELQNRGQIHYHITTPTFIHYRAIRMKWNQLQRVAGYLDEYVAIHGHGDPNSTDIHKVKSPDHVGEYMEKEFCKSIQNATALNAKLWDCSMNLKENSYYSCETTDFNDLFISESEKHQLCTIEKHEWFAVIRFKEPVAEHVLTADQLKEYKSHMYQVANARRRDSVLL